MTDLNFSDLCDDSGNVVTSKLVDQFYDSGILLFKDPRLRSFVGALSVSPDKTPVQHHSLASNSLLSRISPDQLSTLLQDHPLALQVLTKGLVVGDFKTFKEDVIAAFDSVRKDGSGEITTYIPGLSTYDTNKWSVSFCSVDGQVVALGDYKDTFTLQSVTKPILYGIMCDAVGTDTVHRYVGKEPSGFGFNKIVLGYGDVPHNPLINIGAITVASLVLPDESISDRFEFCYSKYKDLACNMSPGGISFNNVVYLSEKHNGHRNYAIGHYLLNKGCIDASSTGRLMEILELYFQLCSIEVDTRTVAAMGATLANGGKNVFTGEEVLSKNTVQNMLSLMYSCGMYDYSGEWSFEIGLPAKSGVSGVIMVILPNLGSLAMWSPPLDHYGNSVRGLGFTRNLLSRFKNDTAHQSVFHPFSSKRATFSSNHVLTTIGMRCPTRNLHTVRGRREFSTSAGLAVQNCASPTAQGCSYSGGLAMLGWKFTRGLSRAFPRL
ncbi:hypothetical protein ACHWQZ_G006528 [Mnemiopsis leidyi]